MLYPKAIILLHLIANTIAVYDIKQGTSRSVVGPNKDRLMREKFSDTKDKPGVTDHRISFAQDARGTGRPWVDPQRPVCSITQHPYYAYIVLDKEKPTDTCGGSIVSRKKILTSARCCKRFKSSTSVWVGYDGNDFDAKINVDSVLTHPQFKSSKDQRVAKYDVCILTLYGTITYNDKVQPIEVAADDIIEATFTDSWIVVTIVGVGLLYRAGSFEASGGNSLVLHCTTRTVQPAKHCTYFDKTFNDQVMFCTDSNLANYGSPVLHNGQLIGILSGGDNSLTVHTRLDAVQKWLAKKNFRSGARILKLELYYVFLIIGTFIVLL